MEELTPELERRLQVEEAWARRTVLSDMINASRLEHYVARRAFVRLYVTEMSTDAVSAPKETPAPQPDLVRLEQPILSRLAAEQAGAQKKTRHPRLYWAAAAAAALV